MYQAYFAIEKEMKATGWHGERAELISSFTKGKKRSLKELTAVEYNQFIGSLKKMNSRESETKEDWQNSPENLMRRKLWNLFVKQMNFTPDRFQNWIVQYGKFHKPLNSHTHNELAQLLTQAELVYKSYINEINKK